MTVAFEKSPKCIPGLFTNRKCNVGLFEKGNKVPEQLMLITRISAPCAILNLLILVTQAVEFPTNLR